MGKVVTDGDAAAITANGVHLIGTGDDGHTVFDFVLSHVFAGIHCAPQLPRDDTLGE